MTELPRFIHKAAFLFPGDPLRPIYWLAGGAILSLIKDGPVSDYDLFSPEPQKVIAWLDEKGLKKTFENDLVANYYWDRQKVQVIKKYVYQSMAETVAAFDFTCVSAAFDGKAMCCHRSKFFLDLPASPFILNKLLLPLSTMAAR